MSETLETLYAPLSEASENDHRDDLAVAPDDAVEASQEASQAEPEAVEAVAAEEPEEAVQPVEEDAEELKARNARLAKELRDQRRKARQLELEAQAYRGERTETRDETIDREIQIRSRQMADAERVNAKANEIYQAGVKEFGRVEMDESVKSLNESFGQNVSLVIDTLIDLPESQKLIRYLGDNPDLADQLANLPPHKLGAALAREATKLATPKPKPVSKAPAPIRPIATQSSADVEKDESKMSMEQLAKLWDKRDFERRFR